MRDTSRAKGEPRKWPSAHSSLPLPSHTGSSTHPSSDRKWWAGGRSGPAGHGLGGGVTPVGFSRRQPGAEMTPLEGTWATCLLKQVDRASPARAWAPRSWVTAWHATEPGVTQRGGEQTPMCTSVASSQPIPGGGISDLGLQPISFGLHHHPHLPARRGQTSPAAYISLPLWCPGCCPASQAKALLPLRGPESRVGECLLRHPVHVHRPLALDAASVSRS